MYDDFDAYLEQLPSIVDLTELAKRHKLEAVLKKEIGQLRFLKADRKRDFRCYIPDRFIDLDSSLGTFIRNPKR